MSNDLHPVIVDNKKLFVFINFRTRTPDVIFIQPAKVNRYQVVAVATTPNGYEQQFFSEDDVNDYINTLLDQHYCLQQADWNPKPFKALWDYKSVKPEAATITSKEPIRFNADVFSSDVCLAF